MLTYLIILIISIILEVIFVSGHLILTAPWAFNSYKLNFSELLRPTLLTVGTLIGIFFRTSSDILTYQKSDQINFKTLLGKTMRSKSFYLAIVASPIVILSFYPAIDAINSNALVFLLAYENGFFFRVIFEKRQKELVTD